MNLVKQHPQYDDLAGVPVGIQRDIVVVLNKVDSLKEEILSTYTEDKSSSSEDDETFVIPQVDGATSKKIVSILLRFDQLPKSQLNMAAAFSTKIFNHSPVNFSCQDLPWRINQLDLSIRTSVG